MKISVVQPNIFWENKSLNFKNLARLITPLFNKTDIVVLPEMFTTGFSMAPEKLAEVNDGETLQWMKNLSEKGNFGICGSYIVKEGKDYFNRWIFVAPGKLIWKYDKRHLFGREKELFTSGRSRLSFVFREVRISAYICYDLRFPVWSRNREKSDIIIYSANWPETRSKVWKTLLSARAIENQCYVAGSNRTGTDGENIKYCGESMFAGPRGEIIASAGTEENNIITCEISLAELQSFRQKFPVLDDADDFSISIREF